MFKMDKKKILQEAEKYFRENLPKSRLKEGDVPPEKEYLRHVLGARKYALLLTKKYNADEFIVEVAVLLHDIGADAGKTHAEESARIVDKFLSKLDINNKTKEKILGCIGHHSMGSVVENIEEQIIQDADGIIFIEDSWKDFLYNHVEEISFEELKKEGINKTKGMMNKIKTEEGIKIAKKHLNKTLKEIENLKEEDIKCQE